MRTPYQATVLRTDVNRSLPDYIPEIFEESELAMADMLKGHGNGAILCFSRAERHFKFWYARENRISRFSYYDTLDRSCH